MVSQCAVTLSVFYKIQALVIYAYIRASERILLLILVCARIFDNTLYIVFWLFKFAVLYFLQNVAVDILCFILLRLSVCEASINCSFIRLFKLKKLGSVVVKTLTYL